MADEMLRIAGRSENGLAKAIKTDDDGNINVIIAQSKVEIIKFNKDNLVSNSIDFYEPRTTSTQVGYLPHSNIGVFDQSLTIENGLDSDINFKIIINYDAGTGNKNGAVIWSGDIPASGRFVFAPDKSNTINANETPYLTNLRQVISIVEFRMPYTYFILNVTPKTIPTTGSIAMQAVRRF